MRKPPTALGTVALVMLLLGSAAPVPAQPSGATPTAPEAAASPEALLPTALPHANGHFEAAADGGFVGVGTDRPVRFGPEGAAIAVGESIVHIAFPGAPPVAPQAGAATGAFSHYFLGADSTQWRTGVPHLAEVVYPQVHPGIDAVFYVPATGGLEFDFRIAPGADFSLARFTVEGGDTALLPDGSLEIRADGDAVTLPAPVSHQDGPDGRIPVASAYAAEDGAFGFALAAVDPALPLTIDPKLAFSTYVGGNQADFVEDAAIDAAGNVYAAGWTFSTSGFVGPGVPVRDPMTTPGADIFVIKYAANGTMLWAAFYGASTTDEEFAGMDVTADGQYIALSGHTTSAGLPLQDQAYAKKGAATLTDSFVAVFRDASPASFTLEYATYLGGMGPDMASDVAFVGASSLVFVGSNTNFNPNEPDAASRYPVKNAAQATHGSSQVVFPTTQQGFPDGVITRISYLLVGDASIEHSTFLGGVGPDEARGVTGDAAGNIYVVGSTTKASGNPWNSLDSDTGFPTTAGVYQRNRQNGGAGGVKDGILVKYTPAGAITFSTLFAGGGSDETVAVGIRPADSGLYVVGITDADINNLPGATPGFDLTKDTGQDAYVVHLSATGSVASQFTYLGAAGSQGGRGIGFDASGDPVILTVFDGTPPASLEVGENPLRYHYQNQTGSLLTRGNTDPLLVWMDPTLTMVRKTARLGSTGFDDAAPRALAVRGTSVAVAGMRDQTPPFPRLNAADTGDEGGNGGYLFRLVPAEPVIGPCAPTPTPVDLGVSVSFTVGVQPGDSAIPATGAYAVDRNYNGVTFDVDGTFDTAASITTTYSAYGTYTPAIRVTDSAGRAGIRTCTAVVVQNFPPVVGLTHDPEPAQLCLPVLFNATAVDGSGGWVVNRQWDFDTAAAGIDTNSNNTTEPHTYRQGGTYSARVNVTDNLGAWAAAIDNVTVEGDAPVAVNDTYEVNTTSIYRSGLQVPPESVLDNDCDPTDLAAMEVEQVSPVTAGTLVFLPDGTFNYTAPTDGTTVATWQYRIVSGALMSEPATVTFNIFAGVNAPPMAANATRTVNEDSSGNAVTLSATDAEDAAGALVYAVVGGITGLTGTPPSLTYTPAANLCTPTTPLTGSFRVTDTGGLNDTGSIQITVTCLPDPPVAANDTASALLNGPFITIDPRTNDADPDTPYGDSLSVDAVGPATVAGASVSIVSGQVRYQPPTGASSDPFDRFPYTLRDGQGNTATAFINVSIQQSNTLPAPVNGTLTLLEGASANVLLNANDPDQSTDSLGFTVASPTPQGATVTLSGVRLATYTPPTNFCGSDTFSFNVTDAAVVPQPGHIDVTVTCVNDAPTSILPADRHVAADAGPSTFTSIVGTPSPGGGADEAGQTVSVVLENVGTPGIFTTAPAVTAGGTLTFDIACGPVAESTVRIRLRDNGGTANGGVNASAPMTFTVYRDAPLTDACDPPTVTSASPSAGLTSGGTNVTIRGLAFRPGATVHFDTAPAASVTFVNATTLRATTPFHGPGTFDIRVTNTDGQSGVLVGGFRFNAPATFGTYSWVADAGPAQRVSAGREVTLDGSGGDSRHAQSVSWTQVSGPTVALRGSNTVHPTFTAPLTTTTLTLQFRITIYDARGSYSQDEVTITVVGDNAPPVAAAGADQAAESGDATLQLDGRLSRDPEGMNLTYSWRQTGGPSVTLRNATQARPTIDLPEVAAGQTVTLTFSLTVGDGLLTAEDSVVVRVSGPALPISSDSPDPDDGNDPVEDDAPVADAPSSPERSWLPWAVGGLGIAIIAVVGAVIAAWRRSVAMV